MPTDTLQKQNGTALNQIQKDQNVKVQSNGLIIQKYSRTHWYKSCLFEMYFSILSYFSLFFSLKPDALAQPCYVVVGYVNPQGK